MNATQYRPLESNEKAVTRIEAGLSRYISHLGDDTLVAEFKAAIAKATGEVVRHE